MLAMILAYYCFVLLYATFLKIHIKLNININWIYSVLMSYIRDTTLSSISSQYQARCSKKGTTFCDTSTNFDEFPFVKNARTPEFRRYARFT